jgi:hypothetical protein
MAIRVRVDAEGWHLLVGPPHANETHTYVAQSPRAALAMLTAWGCHSTDATDALDASGVDWRSMHDAEVLRRRTERDEGK